MKQEVSDLIGAACRELFGQAPEIELTRPEEKFGDYATNVALQLAKQLGKQPREVAETLAEKIKDSLADKVSDVSVAGPGFINLKLSDSALVLAIDSAPAKAYRGQEALVEFGDPNPFKEMHIGHVYSYIVGDTIARLLETSGAKVHRLSYHGDVGLHVAKAIWGMQQSGVEPDKMPDSVTHDISMYYQKGAKAYEEDETARNEMHAINESVYKRDNPAINKLYKWGKKLSFEYFDAILKDLGVNNDRQYFEGETAEIGAKVVRKNTGKVFKESAGAIIYEGEKVGLHTRVFITSRGLPTYETKDLGLAELKRRDFPKAGHSIIITANEQSEYFKVMLAALAEFDQELADSITHLSHGFVSLSTGKMSSRTGNVYSGVAAIVDIETEIKKLYPDATLDTRNAAIKYDFLKHRLGSDITYDVTESFSLEGNSGPYLQYAHARARSIIKKAQAKGGEITGLEAGERTLARKLTEYPEVVDKAIAELMPHHLCTYLYELAQTFNRFYENNRVIGDERQATRLALVEKYADRLKNGLGLLGIASPDKM